MSDYLKTFPRDLEDEAIYIIRETAAQFERPALLFSGGKDSITLVRLAQKAFYPGKVPFPLVHIDTGHNFEETIVFRDWLVKEVGLDLVVGYVQDDINAKRAIEETGKFSSRNGLQTVTLLRTIEENKYDACMGGARRDEEKARAKERIFSVRDDFGQWNAKNQRPEVFDYLNGKIQPGENVRVFPISNWTEIDVWNYIKEENLAIPSIYFAHERGVIERDGVLWPYSDFIYKDAEEVVETRKVRFRTVGDMSCTAALSSDADTIETIIEEILTATLSERGTRLDDKRAEAAMELRKNGGYF
jgi:sulfate adenylyltransferase subunit 2